MAFHKLKKLFSLILLIAIISPTFFVLGAGEARAQVGIASGLIGCSGFSGGIAAALGSLGNVAKNTVNKLLGGGNTVGGTLTGGTSSGSQEIFSGAGDMADLANADISGVGSDAGGAIIGNQEIFSGAGDLADLTNADITTDLAGNISNAIGDIGDAASSFFSGAGGAVASVFAGLSNGAVPVEDEIVRQKTSKLEQKENCLDGIAYAMARLVLRQMTQSTINWINTGFNGEPLFLSDPTQYFGDIAQRELNQAIWEAQRLPNYYANQIVIALTKKPTQQYNLGQVIAQSCVQRQQEAQFTGGNPTDESICISGGGTWNLTEDSAGNVTGYCTGFTITYLTGDQTTRLAKADEQKKSDQLAKEVENATIFGQIKNTFNSMLSAVGFSQVAQVTCGTGGPLDIPGQCIPPGGIGENGNVASNPNAYNCPTTKAEQDALVTKCINGTATFSQCGGLNGWYALTQNSQNNALGVILAAKNNLASRQAGAVGQAQSEIANSGGFLNVKKCKEGTERYSEGDVNNADNFIGCEEITITPGQAVANSLKNVTDSSFRQVELITEVGQSVDRILDALFNQLMTMGTRSLSEVNPLLGSTAGTLGTGLYGAYRNQAELNNAIVNGLNNTDTAAKKYYIIKRETIPIIRNIVNNLNGLSFLGGPTGTNCPLIINQASSDISKATQLSALVDKYETENEALLNDLAILGAIIERSKNATAEEMGELTATYNQIGYRMPTEGNVSNARSEYLQVQTKDTQVAKWLDDCVTEKKAIDSAQSSASSPSF